MDSNMLEQREVSLMLQERENFHFEKISLSFGHFQQKKYIT